MGLTVAALGIKPHTGWAAYVVLAGQPDALEILSRGRIELLPSDGSIPRHMYHDASNLSDAAANQLISRAKLAAKALVDAWLDTLLDDLRSQRAQLRTGAVITSNNAAGDTALSAILRSHPLIHAWEGKLFQDVCVQGCVAKEIPAVRIPEREVWNAASNTMRRRVDAIKKEIDDLRKTVGAPWGSDQKLASAAAAAALGAYDPGSVPRQGPLSARGNIRSVR
ncbi:MAG TPA: hypothetical protein VFE17_01885 [Candidatus Baltobacteraceae bacterium]|jgi:hypothetical protein|nr:hypothetical protein [Candidatus Baltobacteraceae bacterium]